MSLLSLTSSRLPNGAHQFSRVRALIVKASSATGAARREREIGTHAQSTDPTLVCLPSLRVNQHCSVKRFTVKSYYCT